MARTSSDSHFQCEASDARTVTRGAFQFPGVAFSGKKHWPLDLKYRLWQWNELLQQITENDGPELTSNHDPDVHRSANARTIDYALHLYRCRGSRSIRLGFPIQRATRVRGGKKRTFLLVDSRKASPVWNYLKAGPRNRDSDLFRLLRSTPSRMAHLTLGHRHLLVENSDAETIHKELDFLKERLRRFRTLMRPYIRGGYQTFEIERERLGPSAFRDQQVYIHAHMLAIPMAVPIHRSRRRFEQLVQDGWRASLSDTASSEQVGTTELRDRVVRRAEELRRQWAAEEHGESEGSMTEDTELVVVDSPPDSGTTARSAGTNGAGSGRAVLAAIREARVPLARGEIIERSGIAPEEWMAAIRHLLRSGEVIRQGTKRGTRYSLAQSVVPDAELFTNV